MGFFVFVCFGTAMTTAVFIDGAFFIKRLRHFLDIRYHYDAEKMAKIATGMAIRHLALRNSTKGEQPALQDDLYRIFFYDCAPLEKKMHHPISKTALDLSKSQEAIFRRKLHQCLVKKRKVALRLGRLADYDTGWRLKPAVLKDLLQNKRTWSDLSDDDFHLDTLQKGVDMRIGVDITSVTLKQQANRIVLIAGDADFVPAAKLARREGVDFLLDPMHQKISSDLFEHIDGLWSTYDPQRKGKSKS